MSRKPPVIYHISKFARRRVNAMRISGPRSYRIPRKERVFKATFDAIDKLTYTLVRLKIVRWR